MMLLFWLILGKLHSAFLGIYKFHYYHFFIQLNPIKETEQYGSTIESCQDPKAPGSHKRPPSRFNCFYLIPLFLSSIFMGDSLFIYAKGSFNSSSPELERLFTHLIFPPEFYRLGDPMIWNAYAMAFIFSACALMDPLLENKYVLYLRGDDNQVAISQGGKDLPPALSYKLARYHRRMSTFLPLLFLTIVTVAQQFFLYFFVGYWTGSLHDYLVLFLIITSFGYAVFTNMITIIFYYLTVKYLSFKQNYLREELCKLTDQLKGKLAWSLPRKGRTRKSPQGSLPLYRAFQQFPRKILALYGEIAGQNRLWSKYLTLYFAVYMPVICIFSYGALFLQKEVLGTLFFTIFMVDLILLLTLISYQSSMVVYRNIQLHKQSLKFVQHIQLSLTFHTRDLLKFNNLAASLEFIPSIGFKLINHQPINSKMFQMVCMYISITYMFMLEMLRK